MTKLVVVRRQVHLLTVRLQVRVGKDATHGAIADRDAEAPPNLLAPASFEPRSRERRYGLIAEVTVVAQEPERETLEIVIREHTHVDWHLPGVDRGMQAGTRLRLVRRPGDADLLHADGMAATGIERSLLDEVLVFPMAEPGQRGEDLWGTAVPRTVGERWALDPRRLAEIVGDVDRAEARLDRREVVDGIPCVVLISEIDSHRGAQRYQTIDELVVPDDPALPLLRGHTQITMHMDFGDPAVPPGSPPGGLGARDPAHAEHHPLMAPDPELGLALACYSASPTSSW